MKIFSKKNIVLTLISAIISFTAIYSVYAVQASDPIKEVLTSVCPEGYDMEPEKPGDPPKPLYHKSDNNETIGFQCVQTLYHMRMNDFFNRKLDVLAKGLQDPDFVLSETFYPPIIPSANAENIDSEIAQLGQVDFYTKLCPPDNVSTYCVSMEALARYRDYREVLLQIREDLPKDFEITNPDSQEWWQKFTPIEAIVKRMATKNDEIDREIEVSKRTLEAAVGAYDEFRTAYPLHRQYEVIIKDLVKYKNKLESLRREISYYPSKFIDVTSKSCP